MTYRVLSGEYIAIVVLGDDYEIFSEQQDRP